MQNKAEPSRNLRTLMPECSVCRRFMTKRCCSHVQHRLGGSAYLAQQRMHSVLGASD